MRTRLPLVSGFFLALGLACGRGDTPKDTEALDDTQPTVDDSEPGTDDTSYGQVFEMEDPTFVLMLDGVEWKTDNGHYFGSTTSSLIGKIDDTSTGQNVTVSVAGNIKWADTYPVTQISYSEAPSQGEATIWQATNPDLEVEILGFADGTFLFGELTGSAVISTNAGDEKTVSGGTFTAWPKY